MDSFTSYKEKIENEIGAKGYIGELILSGVTPNFQRIPLTGTVAERALAKSKNKLIEEQEAMWAKDKAATYYWLKNFLSSNGISNLKANTERWNQNETNKNPVEFWQFVRETFRVSDRMRSSQMRAYREELSRIYQKENETWKDYQTRFEAIVEKASQIQPIEDTLLVEYFVNGLDTGRHGYSFTEIRKTDNVTFQRAKEILQESEESLDKRGIRDSLKSFNVPRATKGQEDLASETVNYTKATAKKFNKHYQNLKQKQQNSGVTNKSNNKPRKFNKQENKSNKRTRYEGRIPFCYFCFQKFQGQEDKRNIWAGHNPRNCYHKDKHQKRNGNERSKHAHAQDNHDEAKKENPISKTEEQYLIESTSPLQLKEKEIYFSMVNQGVEETVEAEGNKPKLIFDSAATDRQCF